jgi:hypothetical protein
VVNQDESLSAFICACHAVALSLLAVSLSKRLRAKVKKSGTVHAASI